MLQATSAAEAPTPEEVLHVASIDDPVLRNLRITECYFRLSRAFTARTGECANWCTFATWASRQAGCTIRGEDLLSRMDSALREGSALLHPIQALWGFLVRRGVFYPKSRLGRIVNRIHTPFDAFERASDAVARGNLKVFAEIGYEFARFLRECPPDLSPSPFVQSLRAGDPPEGQDLLRKAFLLYHEQSGEKDATLRAQKICLANILIGLHEQTRLQPEIREAMESAPETLSAQSRLMRLLRPLTRGLARTVRDVACRVVTESLMVIELPDGLTLQLSRHLDRSPATDLSKVLVPELAEVLDRFHSEDCGAQDWSSLDQRMRYIARLFRCFQNDAALLRSPFTNEQTERIRAGDIPRGRL